MLLEASLVAAEPCALLAVADDGLMYSSAAAAAAAAEAASAPDTAARGHASDSAESSPGAAPPSTKAAGAATPAGKAGSKPGHRKRARATSEQVSVLESVFMVNRSPASRLREDLAARLGMAPRQVQVWFQNRRAKEKSQQRNPRGFPGHPSALLEQLAFANVSPDLYSMALTSAFMPACAEPGSVLTGPNSHLMVGNPAAMGFGVAAPQPPVGLGVPQDQQLLDGQMALAAAAAAATTHPGGLPYTNPWLSLNADIARQVQGVPMQGLHMPSLAAGLGAAPPPADPTGKLDPNKLDLGFTAASAAGAPMYATNMPDSRRESEMSGVTAVASPNGLGPMASASDLSVATTSSAASPATPPAATTAGPLIYGAPAGNPTPAPGGQPAMACLGPSGLRAPDGTAPWCSVARPPGSSASAAETGPPSQRLAGLARRPAPLALMPQQAAAFAGLPVAVVSAGAGGRLAGGYPPLIPEAPSYMALNATRLTVGSWHRVSKPDTELTCLACVEPPPPKPVQRPGNHRAAEVGSLVGEFQWIIGSCGVRYKMVLPYSAISLIKLYEVPDPTAGLVDPASELAANSQLAFSVLSQALANPLAVGELSIHVYDLPTYYFQAESGEWQAIGDFSEGLSASSSKTHTISGPFGELFRQVRILVATSSRLKAAIDPLLMLWLGNADDPYTAVAGIPQNTWAPCAGAVTLHATKRAEGGQAEADAAKAPTPTSAAPSSIGTLTPTPTSLAFSNVQALSFVAPPPQLPRSARGSVFALREATQHSMTYHGAIAAAMAGGAAPGGVCGLPFKTQRSASLPFIRPMTGHSTATAKANPGSSLSKAIDDDDDGEDGALGTAAAAAASATAGPVVGLGISGAAPPPPSLPLRQRTSYNHLRRPAPYQVAPPAGCPRVNSPQPGISPLWCGGGLGRAPRDSPLGPGMAVNGRRESDVELAMAMSNAFVNGDLLGAHRGLGDLYAMTGVPPSPLSNVALGVDASAMQIDADSPQNVPAYDTAAAATHGQCGGPAQQPAPLPGPGFAGPACEDVGAISTSMMMAIFSAMAPTTAPADGLHGQPRPAPTPVAAGALDAAGLAFDPAIAHTADMWVDWTQAVGGGQLAATDQAASEAGGARGQLA